MLEITAQSPIAYLSAEFGLNAELPVYAGGLGILAGDILKAAADQELDMAGIGLLYRGEETIQEITPEGNQLERDNIYDRQKAGLELVYDGDYPLYIKVHLTQVDVWVQVWKKVVGKTVTLYLLDPDNEKNHSHERRLAYALYSGTQEEIVKQQLILGIGGVKLMRALNLTPALYHINEGRPSFLHWQLVRQAMDFEKMNYKQAVKTAIAKTIYTNHTIVSAGNQGYDVDLLKVYAKYYSGKMEIAVEELLRPGLSPDGTAFNVTNYALNVSKMASSVSLPHYNICIKQWPKYNWVNVTNGVHMPTWQDEKMRQGELQSDQDLWKNHMENKKALADFVAARTGFGYDPEKLVITWARRMTTYKQLNLLFSDIERLQRILLSTEKPVQLLVAGKAHVFDEGGKRIIREVVGYMSNELSGHAIFVPNYEMNVGAMFTRGSDIWINTPIHGQEASGTSGMKAVSNGVLQLTMPDGWCGEVDWEGTGWTIDTNPEKTAGSIYSTLEEKVVPTYYARNSEGLPEEWLKMMRRSIDLSKEYSAERMVSQYREFMYN